MDNLPTTQEPTKDNRQELLVNFLLSDIDNTSIADLAIQAGYSHSYAKSTLYNMIKTDGFQRKLIQAYKASTTTQLPRLIRIQDKALKEYEKDALLAINKPAMIQNIQRVSGAVQDDVKLPQTINIKSLTIAQNVLNQYMDTQEDSGKQLDTQDVVDVPSTQVDR